MIEAFGFNTKQGKTVQLYNTTVEEIKEHLIKVFPNFKPEVIDKIANNPSFYTVVTPVEQPKEKKKRGNCSRESITLLGYELNPLLKLAMSVHNFNKNCYRYWGTAAAKAANHPNISSRLNSFESKYSEVTKIVKAGNINKQELTRKVLELCDSMESVKKSFISSGIMDENKDAEFVTSTGRKLGMLELTKRIEAEVGNCNAALNITSK